MSRNDRPPPPLRSFRARPLALHMRVSTQAPVPRLSRAARGNIRYPLHPLAIPCLQSRRLDSPLTLLLNMADLSLNAQTQQSAICSSLAILARDSRGEDLSAEESAFSAFDDLLVDGHGRVVHADCAGFVVDFGVDPRVADEIDDPLLAFVRGEGEATGKVSVGRGVSSVLQYLT